MINFVIPVQVVVRTAGDSTRRFCEVGGNDNKIIEPTITLGWKSIQ
jgi:hypothetical protein